MKNKKNVLYSVIIMLSGVVNFALQAQQTNVAQAVKTKDTSTLPAPKGIVRTIKQDKKGTIWITSWEGVYKYDGTTFTNITSKVSSARFFTVLEDSKGNFWLGTVGAGVYYYDGKTFQNFTTKDGLADDTVTDIYEDKSNHIWFSTGNGTSRYDGKSFWNLKINEAASATPRDSIHTDPIESKAGDSIQVSSYQQPLPKEHWMHNSINSIMQDKKGKFWMGTSGYAAIYDGKTFTTIINNDGKPFRNVRSIIKDKKGNMWLGGNEGLWRYDGKTFTNFTRHFVGYIYEDKKGNIWTSSDKTKNTTWALSRYGAKSLHDNKPTVTEITTKQGMFFGILEANDGSIWFGALDGVYRYNGQNVADFKSKE